MQEKSMWDKFTGFFYESEEAKVNNLFDTVEKDSSDFAVVTYILTNFVNGLVELGYSESKCDSILETHRPRLVGAAIKYKQVIGHARSSSSLIVKIDKDMEEVRKDSLKSLEGKDSPTAEERLLAYADSLENKVVTSDEAANIAKKAVAAERRRAAAQKKKGSKNKKAPASTSTPA